MNNDAKLPKGIFKHPKSQFLHMRFFFQGKPRAESTGEADPKKAPKKRRDKLAELRMDKAGKLDFVPKTQVRVRELLESLEVDYRLREVKSLPAVKSHMKPLHAALEAVRAQNLTTEMVDGYIESRLIQGKAKTTVNRETQLLGQAFTLAIERKKETGVRSAPKIRHLSEKGNERRGFFEKHEFEAHVQHMPEYLKGFTWFGYLSGWRKSEIASLTWSDVDLMGKVIRLRGEHSKNGKGRVLALAGKLWGVIERQRMMMEYQIADAKIGISQYVFHRDGAPIGDIRKAWATACRKTGVKKLYHDLRRTRARDMRKAGVSEDVCMTVLGHRTRSIFTRYDIVDERDQQEALLRTEEHLEAAAYPQEQQQTTVPMPQEAVGRIS